MYHTRFLLAQLQMDMLKDSVIIGEIKKKLRVLESGGVGLDDRYKAAMERIMGQSIGARERAIQILSWISHAKRPLTVDELLHALAVNEGDPDFNDEFLLSEEHL